MLKSYKLAVMKTTPNLKQKMERTPVTTAHVDSGKSITTGHLQMLWN